MASDGGEDRCGRPARPRARAGHREAGDPDLRARLPLPHREPEPAPAVPPRLKLEDMELQEEGMVRWRFPAVTFRPHPPMMPRYGVLVEAS